MAAAVAAACHIRRPRSDAAGCLQQGAEKNEKKSLETIERKEKFVYSVRTSSVSV